MRLFQYSLLIALIAVLTSLIALLLPMTALAQPAPTTPEPPTAAAPAAASATDQSRIHLSAAFYTSSGDDFRFRSARVDSGAGTLDADYDMTVQSAQGLSFEVWQNAMHSFGWAAGAAIETIRDLRELSGSGDNNWVSAVHHSGKIQMNYIYANLLYRWEGLYLPVGLNLSLPRYRDSGEGDSSYSFSGGVGWQIGIGNHFTEHFSGELISRMVRVRGSGNDAGISVDLRTGMFPDLQLIAKWDFY
jgi:hypothetical protein